MSGPADGWVVASRAALAEVVAAALALEQSARLTDPRLRAALAEFVTSSRSVGPERPWLRMAEAADALG